MYLLKNNSTNCVKTNKTALKTVNALDIFNTTLRGKYIGLRLVKRWSAESAKRLDLKKIVANYNQSVIETDLDLTTITWKIVKRSGRIRGDRKDLYAEKRVHDVRLVKVANLDHPLVCFFLGKYEKFNLKKNFKIAFVEELQEVGLLENKKLMIQRWVGNFVYKTNAKIARARRRMFKSSGMYIKIHSWKFKRRVRHKLIRKWGNFWIRNEMRKVNYFKGSKVNQRFKLVTLAEFSKTYFRRRQVGIFRVRRTVIEALEYKAWKRLVDIEDVLEKYELGGFGKKRLRVQKLNAKTIAKALVSSKRKSYQKKTAYGLADLTGILNPTKIKKQIGHPYHLVTPSVLPFTLSVAFFGVFQNFLGFIASEGWHLFSIYQYHSFFFVNLFLVIITWILEIFKEEQSGAHTLEIQKGFQYAILLFILSELMLFFSFFWAYFHYTLNSNSFTGGTYTPRGLVVFYWYRIPLLNTLLLLASGLSLTIAHVLLVESDKVYRLKAWIKILSHIHVFQIWSIFTSGWFWHTGKKDELFNNLNKKDMFWSRFNEAKKIDLQTNNIRYSKDNITVASKVFLLKYKGYSDSTVSTPIFWVIDTSLKGFVFLVYQAYEYTSSMFAINDSIYGAVFFSLTGLHGIHVFIGVMSLFTYVIVTLARNTEELYIAREKIRKHRYIRLWTRYTKANTSYRLKYFNHRVAFDGAAWYWHFVDVVWFFVFVFVYWWGFAN